MDWIGLLWHFSNARIAHSRVENRYIRSSDKYVNAIIFYTRSTSPALARNE